MTYIKIRSWHIVRAWVLDQPVCYCGRKADRDMETVDQLPADKSCEACLRIVERYHDRQVTG